MPFSTCSLHCDLYRSITSVTYHLSWPLHSTRSPGDVSRGQRARGEGEKSRGVTLGKSTWGFLPEREFPRNRLVTTCLSLPLCSSSSGGTGCGCATWGSSAESGQNPGRTPESAKVKEKVIVLTRIHVPDGWHSRSLNGQTSGRPREWVFVDSDGLTTS